MQNRVGRGESEMMKAKKLRKAPLRA